MRIKLGFVAIMGLGVSGCSGTIEVAAPDAAPPADVDAGPGFGTVDIDPAVPGDISPWTDLPESRIALVGGDAASPTGTGRDGGVFRATTSGSLRFDPTASLPDWPAAPPSPTGGTAIDSGDLTADVAQAGTLRISGDVATGSGDQVRTIMSTGGDIIVDGTLRAGQPIALRAPAGTVYVTGVVTTARAEPGAVDAAGTIAISARDVVIRGQLRAGGGDGGDGDGDGGNGAAITIAASREVLIVNGRVETAGGRSRVHGGAAGPIVLSAPSLRLSGTLDTRGGDAIGPAATLGGAAGDVRLSATGDLDLRSAVRIRGGAAVSAGLDATGGSAGRLHLDTDGTAAVAGLVDARGGLAVAPLGGVAVGGAAGQLLVGESETPAELRVQVPLHVDGGAGEARGGAGGEITLTPHGGDLVLALPVHFDGGASRAAPGPGGQLTGRIGPSAGGVVIAGAVIGRGGSATGGIDADGGDAGNFDVQILTHTGPFTVEASGELAVDGGAASGAGKGGGGGYIDILTRDGDFSMAGHIFARGGDAPIPGGTGGDGGPLYVWTDTDADGIGGNQTIQPTGVIDVSGGAGDPGGSARNNFDSGIEYFPEGRHQIAVLLNSDTAPGRLTDGVIQNLGMIIAHGAAADGWGGDVIYHGRKPEQDADPLPGNLDVEGDGVDGSYLMQ